MKKETLNYLKTIVNMDICLDYLQLKNQGMGDLIDNPKLGKLTREEKRDLGLGYFLYKFTEKSGINNARILWTIDSFFYKNSKIQSKIEDFTNASVKEIIDDAEMVLNLVFEGEYE